MGRYKKEKGVFSLRNIFDTINLNYELNIVGLKKKITPSNDKVKLFNEVNSTKKIISFYAKNARGAMARFIIQNRVLDEADLKKFNLNGYLFYPEKSNNDQIVFIRNVCSCNGNVIIPISY